MRWVAAAIILAPLLSGCLFGGEPGFDGPPFEGTLHAPPLPAVGSWWSMHVHRDAQGSGSDGVIDEDHTFWVVAHRDVNGTMQPLLLRLPGLEPGRAWRDARDNATFDWRQANDPRGDVALVLGDAGEPFAEGGIAAYPLLPGYEPRALETDCRHASACPLDALHDRALVGRGWGPFQDPIPFPFTGRVDFRENLSRDSYTDHTWSVEGWASVRIEGQEQKVVRIHHGRDYTCFECFGGTRWTSVDYAPSLGLVVRRVQDGASGGWEPSTQFLQTLIAVGTLDPPPLDEIGRTFARAQASIVELRQVSIVNVEGGSSYSGDVDRDNTFRASFSARNLRGNDTLRIRWERPAGALLAEDLANVSSFEAHDVGQVIIRMQALGPQDVLLHEIAPRILITLDRSVSMSCDLSICQAPVPVGPGITRVQASLTERRSPWIAGTLELMDAKGVVRDTKDCACTVSAELAADEAGEQDWTFRWRPSTGASDPGVLVRLVAQ